MSASFPDEHRLDGNVLAGVLSDVFIAEVTTAVGQCAACLRTGPLADTAVYTRAPGVVARCRGCGAVLARVIQAPGRVWLDLRGLHFLQLAIPGR